MRLTTALNMQNLSPDGIRARLADCDRQDAEFATVEKRLAERLDMVMAANSAEDIETASLHLAQVQVKRASLQRVQQALREQALDARARLLSVRFTYEGQRAVEVLKVEGKLARELRFAIKSAGTQYLKWLRAWQTAMGYLARFDALPDSASQSTWKNISILISLRKAFPGIAEIQRLTEHAATRPERLGLWEWGGRQLLHKAISSGEALASFYKKNGSELERVAAVLQNDPRIMKILDTLREKPTTAPKSKQKPAQKKHQKQSARKQHR